MKIIIAGGRDFENYAYLKEKCDSLIKSDSVTIVSGAASGADSLGVRYAEEKKLKVDLFPANWKEFGKRAGVLRNEAMANYADVLIAFWDGKSRGTRHMIDAAHERGMPTYVFMYNKED